VRWQNLALLVLRRVGLCVGQNQMCSRKLSGCGWLKLFLKKCGGKKIKNTEGSVPNAFGIGLLVVQLLYRFYVVGHLSKWFTFLLFLVICLMLSGRPLRLRLTVLGLAMWRNLKHKTSILH